MSLSGDLEVQKIISGNKHRIIITDENGDIYKLEDVSYDNIEKEFIIAIKKI